MRAGRDLLRSGLEHPALTESGGAEQMGDEHRRCRAAYVLASMVICTFSGSVPLSMPIDSAPNFPLTAACRLRSHPARAKHVETQLQPRLTSAWFQLTCNQSVFPMRMDIHVSRIRAVDIAQRKLLVTRAKYWARTRRRCSTEFSRCQCSNSVASVRRRPREVAAVGELRWQGVSTCNVHAATEQRYAQCRPGRSRIRYSIRSCRRTPPARSRAARPRSTCRAGSIAADDPTSGT